MALCKKRGVSNRQGAAGEGARASAHRRPGAPGCSNWSGALLRLRARRAQARGFIASLAGASRNAVDAGLVRSVLAAGFYPQVRAPDPRAGLLRATLRSPQVPEKEADRRGGAFPMCSRTRPPACLLRGGVAPF
jgi:hypothetical protein